MLLRAPIREGHSAYFGQLNAGKQSIALDLKSPDAIKLVHRMVESADILVENFRPGVMERLGLGYEALRKINPRLIYCSISGYGQIGPQAERAAYAMIVHAESGFDRALMRYAGDRDRPAGGRCSLPISSAAFSASRQFRRRWCSARAPAKGSASMSP